jgi:AcrR family transcriptional regulator
VESKIRAETKGQRTKRKILARAAEMFNLRGYANTAVTDVSASLGLEKGAVYNYFPTKQALANASFDYNAAIVRDAVFPAGDAGAPAVATLRSMLEPYRRGTLGDLIKGGCPLMNTAVETTNTDPTLRNRARRAFREWLSRIEQVVRDGSERGELRRDLDPAVVATTFVATIEGGMLLSRLFHDRHHLELLVARLDGYIASLEA